MTYDDRQQTMEVNENGICINGYFVSKKDIRERKHFELEWFRSRFDDDTRIDACNTLVDALLASCENQEERIRLGVALLGYDPRDDDTTTISDFTL